MNSPCILSVSFVTLLILAQSLQAQQPPTMAEVQADFDKMDYQAVVRKSQQILSLRGNAAMGVDREKLHVLRGEAYLRLKQNANAVTAFTAASKETSDSSKAGLYTATATLIGKSPGGKYTPRQPAGDARGGSGTRGTPIDLAEEASRKEAFAALFNDELKIAMPKIQAQSRQTSLNPLVQGMKMAGGLRNLEVAGTGKDDTVKDILSDLGTRASTLMLDEIKKMSAEVEKIAAAANQTSTDTYLNQRPGTATGNTQKRGLIGTDSRTLTEVVNMTGTITKACDELSAAVGSDKLFSAVKEDSQRLSMRAYDVLSTDYSGGSRTNIRTQPQTPPGGRTGSPYNR